MADKWTADDHISIDEPIPRMTLATGEVPELRLGEDRDYLAEARAIVNGQSRLLPEVAHLRALFSALDARVAVIEQLGKDGLK